MSLSHDIEQACSNIHAICCGIAESENFSDHPYGKERDSEHSARQLYALDALQHAVDALRKDLIRFHK